MDTIAYDQRTETDDLPEGTTVILPAMHLEVGDTLAGQPITAIQFVEASHRVRITIPTATITAPYDAPVEVTL